jgi:predicted Zn-dependent protease with MMP-like domain
VDLEVDMRGSRGEDRAFERMVAEALDSLPSWVSERLENVEVLVEDEPPEDVPNLLGMYEGVPLTKRGLDYTGVLPDRVILFRSTIEAAAGGDEQELKRVIQDTVTHEMAHFFGISDERLHELGRD